MARVSARAPRRVLAPELTVAVFDRDGLPKPDYREIFLRLQKVADDYYVGAVRTGVHAFIEHTGIMAEHLTLLKQAAAAGLQAEHINVHGSERQPMHGFQAQYLGEKFACIFAPYFTPETFDVFVAEMRKGIVVKKAAVRPHGRRVAK